MRILMFSNFELPDSCANSLRVINFAKIFKALGHEVDVVGVSYSKSNELIGTFHGIEYKMIQADLLTGINAYKRIIKLKKSIRDYLESSSVTNPFDAILLSNIYFDFADVFADYAKKNQSDLIINSVEWYEKDNVIFRGLAGKINLIKNRIALKKIHTKFGNIIAISSLLDNYYKERGCNTISIPTIIDFESEYSEIKPRENNTSKIHIAYAGVPGKKDYITNAINAIELLTNEEKERVCFDFYGIKSENLYSLGISKEFLHNNSSVIRCHGKIPYEQVKEKIASADFTILIRPQLRYANAGFPTKVGESMSCGTPVIANITSDLGKYIIDGKTGIICENETKEACAKAIKRAIGISPDERKKMRENAISMAKESFDYRVYIDVMDEYTKKLKGF